MDIYRIEGIKAVEQELEKNLRDIDFWKKYLEKKNVEYGYYEYNKYIIVAQKENKELSLFENSEDGYKLITKEKMIIGENLGDKFLEGDKRTPEGSYDLVQKRVGLDQFYGPFALVTSYPNSFDKSLNKKGHGIWIHGMPLDGERENYTQGCLALDNDRLKVLDSNINLNKTVLITSHDELKKTTKEDIALILSSIYKWKDAWKYSNINEYLSFYSRDFKRADRTDFNTFSAQKRQIFAKNEDKTINLFNIDISPYPNSLNKNMYRILMDEEYTSPSVKFYGKKELFVEIANNQLQILTED
ncbi:L,D-transpeptidase family protein [Aliarcobacter cibarius]|jgi:murein L,D-transpeptidase YafK|uniref:Peptidoglycan peptidase 2 n=1 Tax=Aliarcobacter cibarius TaxID=255507 RepID=A0A7L5JR40_9BACT|nr:L,D-transpeptidase family protein [Aliarcobacter cibarius]QKJ27677.1 peptidoglycan peptidase 2 [Aliarcobacter cibarius]